MVNHGHQGRVGAYNYGRGQLPAPKKDDKADKAAELEVPESAKLNSKMVEGWKDADELSKHAKNTPFANAIPDEEYSHVVSFTLGCEPCFRNTQLQLLEWLTAGFEPIMIDGTGNIARIFAPTNKMPGLVKVQTALLETN